MRAISGAVGLIFAAVLWSAGGGIAVAGPPHANPYTDDAPSRPREPISGVVSGVDYGAGRLGVTARGRSVTIVVTPSTAIYRNGKYATLTDLQPGMRVDITVNEVDGNLIAQTIRIH